VIGDAIYWSGQFRDGTSEMGRFTPVEIWERERKGQSLSEEKVVVELVAGSKS